MKYLPFLLCLGKMDTILLLGIMMTNEMWPSYSASKRNVVKQWADFWGTKHHALWGGESFCSPSLLESTAVWNAATKYQ